MWIEGFMHALSGMNILWLLFGSAIGLVIGVLPALGANFGVALMLPFTFGMDPAAAIIMLCAIHAACNYGDSVTSILLNVPGSPGTVATCWDGYPLAQQGRGGEALGIATLSSFIGGVAVWLMLALMVAPITKLALAFGAPEYFALVFMALGLVSVAAKGETMKGLIMACMGLAFSAVGQDEVLGTTYRFTFGISWLEAGIPVVVSTLGIFAIPQVIDMLSQGGSVAQCAEIKDSILRGFRTPLRKPLTLLRAGGVGAFVGILPALGVALAGIAAYLTEKKYSREADGFGKGAPAGLVAAEVGKGACVVGDLIPTFTLGVPGSVTGAILMAALIMQGIEPGPKFLLSGVLPYTVFAGLLLAQATFLITGVLFGKQMCRVAFVPNVFLAPSLTVLVFLGAYATQNSSFDILLALLFGLAAYALEKANYPVVCMVLGLILGPILEANFHRSLGESLGSYAVFFTRPMAVGMFVITFLFLTGPTIMHLLRPYRKKPAGIIAAALEGEEAAGSQKNEVVLLVISILIFAVFILMARQYSPLVRLFPDLASALGLFFALWRLVAVGLAAKNSGWRNSVSERAAAFSFFQGYLSQLWTIVTLALYVTFVYLFGFIAASVLYIMGVIAIASGFTKWRSIVLAGVLMGLGVWLLAHTVHILLPLGWLTDF